MRTAFLSILVTSAVGTALALLLAALRPCTKKLFSAGWHYFMWLAVLLVMILPVRIPLLESTSAIPEYVVLYADEIPAYTQTAEISDAYLTVQSKIPYISLIWLAVFLIIFISKLVSYFVFLGKIRHTSVSVSCPQLSAFTKRNIRVRKNDSISSPLMIGLFRPMLLLPDVEMTAAELRNVLSHETVHFKRGDILYKWLACIVRCIHWFNPAVYFICRQMNIDCEISCDLKVTENMSREEKLGYINTILSLLSNAKFNSLTTGMTGTKSALKRRFKMIKKHPKTTKIKIIISVALAAVIVATSLFASGLLADSIIYTPDSTQTFVWPCPDAFALSRGFDKDSHPAIDIPAKGGSDVLAIFGGTVTSAGYDKEHGNFVITDDGSATVLYAHLSAVDVKEGETVSAGDIIGKVGKTGLATGDHLHLELTEYGEAVNPLEYAVDINVTEPPQRPF